MRYLRMLSNSIVAGVMAACYLVVLVLQLNPTLGLHSARLAPLVATVGLFYALHLAVICYLVLVLRQLLATEVFSPAWISVGVLSWLSVAAAAAGAALMWANLQAFALVLEPATVRTIERGAGALAASAALFAVIGLLRGRFRARGRLAWAALLVAIAAGSITVPAALRGRGEPLVLAAHSIDVGSEFFAPERTARVRIVAIDAGSLEFITRAASEGRLPNFGRILDAGAVMHLATLRPTSPEAVWTAVATGKLPQKNGVRSAAVYRLDSDSEPIRLLPDYCFAHALVRFGFVLEERQTSAALRTRTIWSILSTLGIPVGVVGWPLTHPATVVRGYLVSDQYHRFALTPSGIDDPSGLYPPDLQAEASQVFETADLDPPSLILREAAVQGTPSRYDTPGRTDRAYDRISQTLAKARPTQVTAVRYQSLDPIGHYFLRYAVPEAFGDVTDDERRRLGAVLEQHYGLIDEALGRAIAALGPEDLMLVVSGYGMEPLGLGRRLVERIIGDPDLSGTHDSAPDGFLMAYGAPVARGRRPARASVVDVAPTILYFLGLPIGRDMDGYARADLFQRTFTEDRPITYIPTYDR